MDNNSDNDEIALCEVINHNQQSNIKSRKNKFFNLRRTIIISILLISLVFLVIAIIGAILFFEKPANYKGHKVYKLMPTNVDDLNAIIKFEKDFQVLVKIDS